MADEEKHRILAGIGIGLFCFELVYVIIVIIYLCSVRLFREIPFIIRHGIHWLSPSTIFVETIILHIIARIAFFAVDIENEPVSDMVLSRVAYLLLLSAFLVLIFHWFDITLAALRKDPKYAMREGFYKLWPVRIACILVNVFLWVSQTAFWIAFGTTYSEGDIPGRNRAYKASVWFGIIVAAACLVLFLVSGVGLFILLLLLKIPNKRAKMKIVIKTIVLTILSSLCFAMKFILFALGPLGESDVDPAVFYVLGFFVPEILLCVVFVPMEVVTWRRRIVRQLMHHNNNINNNTHKHRGVEYILADSEDEDNIWGGGPSGEPTMTSPSRNGTLSTSDSNRSRDDTYSTDIEFSSSLGQDDDWYVTPSSFTRSGRNLALELGLIRTGGT